jgi:hypothetical protein
MYRKSVGELSIGFVKVSQQSVVFAFIPTAIAFLYYSTAAAVVNTFVLYGVYSYAMQTAYPAIFASEFDQGLTPPASMVFTNHPSYVFVSSWRRAIMVSVSLVRFGLLAVSPLLFEVYAYSVLFRSPDVDRLSAGVSLAVTLMLLAAAGATAAVLIGEEISLPSRVGPAARGSVVAGERRGSAEAEVDHAAGPVEPAPEPGRPAQPATQRAGE